MCSLNLFLGEVKHGSNMLLGDLRFYSTINHELSVLSGYRPMLILVVSSDTLCLDGRDQGLKEAKEPRVAEQQGWASGRIGCGLYHATPRSENHPGSLFY